MNIKAVISNSLQIPVKECLQYDSEIQILTTE